MMRRALGVALLCVTSTTVWAQSETEQSPDEDASFEARDLSDYGQGKIPSGIVQLQAQSTYYPPYVFVVDKQERVLSVWSSEGGTIEPIAAYPADIGKNQGNKMFLGDKKTPEGIYFMLEKYERSALDYNTYGSRAFTTNYPNFFDRREKKTGSGIWLHAVPDTVPLTRGSRGCVVVRDDVIKTLHPYFKPGLTPIVIQNSVTFRTPEEQSSLRGEFHSALAQWQKAWQTKDLERYMGFYHSDFRSQRMDKKAWHQHKERLNEQYESISVSLSEPVIYEHQDQFIVRFFQHYQSDQYEDFGEKTLYLVREEGALKIVGEDWAHKPRLVALEEIQRHAIAAIDCAKDKDGCSPNKESAL